MQCGFLGSGLWVVVRFFVQMGVHSIKFRDHHLRASEERSLVRGDEEFCFDCSVKRWMGGAENMGRYLLATWKLFTFLFSFLGCSCDILKKKQKILWILCTLY